MSRRRISSPRFDLEALEHRLTPSMSTPPGLLISQSAEVRAHPFAPSSQTLNAPPQTQTFSLQGLGGLFRQVLVVDLSSRVSVLRIDFSLNNSSLLQFSAQVSNLKTKVDTSTATDKGGDVSDNTADRTDSAAKATTPAATTANSPAARQNQQLVVPTNAAAQTNTATPTNNPAQVNAAGVNTAGQAVTTTTDRNVLLFTANGARNNQLAQDRFDPATLPLVVNQPQLIPQELQPIATGPAAAPPRPQLTLPLNGGSNARPQAPEQDNAIDEPALPMNLEAADPVVPLLPALLDQFLEETSDLSPVREWIFTAMPGNPFWAYALVAAAGSAGAGWLTTRRKEKRKGEPFTPEEEDALTDGYPA